MNTAFRTFALGVLLLVAATGGAWAHHFKGLPHYNYFENYPQVPEEEFLGEVADYEISLVVYDFQGIDRKNVEDPDNVRLFVMIFNLLDNRVYGGKLTLEILDRGEVVETEVLESSELENLYAMYRPLPNTGKYALRLTLHDEDGLQTTIPFRLSSQKVHWGPWVAGDLVLLLAVAAVGARKARVKQDRIEARKRKGS
ncbi:MAG: hypothetical protein HKO57_09310 [Akkermansiaceae bacterium]|nr:hypothetical protein [Akkermansiaceae bacterium]